MAEILPFCKTRLTYDITSDSELKNRTTIISQTLCGLPPLFSLGNITNDISLVLFLLTLMSQISLVKAGKVTLSAAKCLPASQGREVGAAANNVSDGVTDRPTSWIDKKNERRFPI